MSAIQNGGRDNLIHSKPFLEHLHRNLEPNLRLCFIRELNCSNKQNRLFQVR